MDAQMCKHELADYTNVQITRMCRLHECADYTNVQITCKILTNIHTIIYIYTAALAAGGLVGTREAFRICQELDAVLGHLAVFKGGRAKATPAVHGLTHGSCVRG